ncbi:Anti-sigma regulatory factor (Ser/Thr protein kinase) [Streptomyces sp. DvalAA-14]|uniref:ATP-binding protein n=1 Tax=unclassified Streptomyces TaxID=2593676 RepID=UPI00081B94C3|nr:MULTISPECIES: ATP-binding protein [unclassified Streptomyces]MYS23407.1 ATP-binding protein [Streptomyces sp. SID4948]SCE32783.1 Anti-sigma regulatory factor (Ser/Thr protein kinase) [Streptomyces sp. DvalAA-14]
MTLGYRPLISSLDFAPDLFSVRNVRHYTGAALQGWHVPDDTVEAAVTIVSELAANAVRHAGAAEGTEPAAGRPGSEACTVVLQLWPDRVCVLVWDHNRRPPVLQRPSQEAEGGRGLQLVDLLSEAWGYAYKEAAPGKVVWSHIPLPDLAELEPASAPKGLSAPTSELVRSESNG